jgi:hypothetical protein
MMMARKHGGRPYHTGQEEQAWWAPRRYGYGAGLPIAWQGWAVTLAYALLITGAAFGLLPRHIPAFVAITVAATAVLILICARKTRGGWRWRWGERG